MTTQNTHKVCWKSKVSDAKGTTVAVDERTAKNWAEDLNRKYPDLHHSVVKVDQDN